jgi:hypothetical protein
MPHLHLRGHPGERDSPEAAHGWLERLLGEWIYEARLRASGNGTRTAVGAESVRALADLWVMAEGDGQLHGARREGGTVPTVLTLAYDPGRRRFAGTWTGPRPAEPYVLGGTLDPRGEVLTLHAGPSPGAAGPVPAGYRTELEFEDENRLTVTAWDLAGSVDEPPVLVARFHRWR